MSIDRLAGKSVSIDRLAGKSVSIDRSAGKSVVVEGPLVSIAAFLWALLRLLVLPYYLVSPLAAHVPGRHRDGPAHVQGHP